MNLILDSGSFSMWKRGVTIDPDAYIDFVRHNKKYLFAHVTLDTIPGSPGKRRHVSEQESAACAKRSYEAHQYLKRANLHPTPVVHQYEPIEWLDRYLDDGETYIGVSPYLRSHKPEIRTWLDKCFLRLTNESGLPIVKTHGFGMTTPEFLARYPWSSVDSTSWVLAGAYGSVAVPFLKEHGYDFLCGKQFRLTNIPNTDRDDFDVQGSIIQGHICDYFDSIGLDIDKLRNDDKARYKAALIFFRELSKQIGRVKFSPGIRNHAHRSAPGIDIPAVRFFAATTPARPKNEALNEVGVEDRLLSFWEIREQPDHFISAYWRTGLPCGGAAFKQNSGGTRGVVAVRTEPLNR